MNRILLSLFFPLFFLCSISEVVSDGQRDYNETCSFRSQVANYFRETDSAEGCMSEKGLICVSHKCVCDPTSIYVQPSPTASGTAAGSSSGSVRATIGNFLLKKVMGGSGTTASPAPSASGSKPPATTGGRCLGRSGSPCLTEKSACVEHAACVGSPQLCRCQGIYSSNPSGMCSKRATVTNEVIKRVTGGFTG